MADDIPRRGNMPVRSRAGITQPDIVTGSDGATDGAGTGFSSTSATFETHGLEAGDILKLSDQSWPNEFIVASVDSETALTLTEAAPTDLTTQNYTVYKTGIDPLDVTEAEEVMLIAEFEEDGGDVTIQPELEVTKAGTKRIRLSTTQLTGDGGTAAMAIIKHGGLYLRPVVSVLTGGGTINLRLVPTRSKH